MKPVSAACGNASKSAKDVGNFVLAPEALDDLDLVWVYIAQDNPEAADRVIESTYKTCEILAAHPELGRLRRFPGNHPPNIRSFVVTDFPNYVIFYRAVPEGVEIVRVLHGTQNIEEFFSK